MRERLDGTEDELEKSIAAEKNTFKFWGQSFSECRIAGESPSAENRGQNLHARVGRIPSKNIKRYKMKSLVSLVYLFCVASSFPTQTDETRTAQVDALSLEEGEEPVPCPKGMKRSGAFRQYDPDFN